MKILIVDNITANRRTMKTLLENQTVTTVSSVLEAPNRVMGSMLIEAVEFDLVILGGVLENTLPDGTIDHGNGVVIASHLLNIRPDADLVLWSDNQMVKNKFEALMKESARQCLPHHCWSKQLSTDDIESHLLQFFSTKSQSHFESSMHHLET